MVIIPMSVDLPQHHTYMTASPAIRAHQPIDLHTTTLHTTAADHQQQHYQRRPHNHDQIAVPTRPGWISSLLCGTSSTPMLFSLGRLMRKVMFLSTPHATDESLVQVHRWIPTLQAGISSIPRLFLTSLSSEHKKIRRNTSRAIAENLVSVYRRLCRPNTECLPSPGQLNRSYH
jgi:hypothetical protein